VESDVGKAAQQRQHKHRDGRLGSPIFVRMPSSRVLPAGTATVCPQHRNGLPAAHRNGFARLRCNVGFACRHYLNSRRKVGHQKSPKRPENSGPHGPPAWMCINRRDFEMQRDGLRQRRTVRDKLASIKPNSRINATAVYPAMRKLYPATRASSLHLSISQLCAKCRSILKKPPFGADSQKAQATTL